MEIRVNGKLRSVPDDGGTPLLWVLRDTLKLTGTKFGCGIAQCGACTVLVDGQPIRSCITPVESVGTSPVTTIEGLSGREADAIRAAWTSIDVPQCGYCQSGQIVSATALLSGVRNPDDPEIDSAMAGNICRCGTYSRIRAAIKSAAASLSTPA
ncbi:(2Fe-2S)-binding protein [Sphingomonas montanisoli]|uniref:(2Fe-2S)-binding protein n=1 Tax=Sphingomonas montanisoli TaxID=2606412 RepID=A0A5D9CH92_9SPHN|nr:(2Fe-2S)-binding protein [Sphingomonas montanisoli]TZG29455.1 (2Fe-2S)-binding protein [Sphingomonas montanisoli]